MAPSKRHGEKRAAFRAGEVQCLFAVDLFNEGLDIPDVDTLLLLRPAQSATDGARLHRSAAARIPLRRPLPRPDRVVPQASFHRDRGGFPYLPGGSRLILDKVSQQIVTENVRASLRLNQRREMVNDVRSHGIASLTKYLSESGHELADVYSGRGS